MTIWNTVTTLVVSLTLCVVAAGVDVSVLDPKTLSDDIGNTADENSNITYAPLDDDITYKAEAGNDLGAIAVFYDLAQSIVDTSLPGAFPFGELKFFILINEKSKPEAWLHIFGTRDNSSPS